MTAHEDRLARLARGEKLSEAEMRRVLRGPATQSPKVVELGWQIKNACRVAIELEHRFSPNRKYRFDIAIPAYRIGVEVDGGGFTGKKGGGLEHGGHSTGAGHRDDVEKDGHALELGWIVVRCLPEHVKTAQALRWVEAAIAQRVAIIIGMDKCDEKYHRLVCQCGGASMSVRA